MPYVVIAKNVYNQYSDYDSQNIMFPVSAWEEITEEKLSELRESVNNANSYLHKKRSMYSYQLIVRYELEEVMPDILQNAAEFVSLVEKEKANEEKKKAAAKAKREETARARKLRQLEKLKKELGETE